MAISLSGKNKREHENQGSWWNFQYPKIFLDGLTGIGARSLRVANEIDGVDEVIANALEDVPQALNVLDTTKIKTNDSNETDKTSISH